MVSRRRGFSVTTPSGSVQVPRGHPVDERGGTEYAGRRHHVVVGSGNECSVRPAMDYGVEHAE